MKSKLKVMFSFLLQWMYSDRRGTDKNHPGQTFQTKNSWQTPGQKPSRTKTYVCMRVLLKLVGGPRCVTYFRGGGCSEMCDMGKEGSKLIQNSVTYFMDFMDIATERAGVVW